MRRKLRYYLESIQINISTPGVGEIDHVQQAQQIFLSKRSFRLRNFIGRKWKENQGAGSIITGDQPGDKEHDSTLSRLITNLHRIENEFDSIYLPRKRMVISAIFPEGCVYDGEKHRAARVNEIVTNIKLINS